MPDKEPKPPRFEMEIQLPHILTEPLKLEDGTILAEGDKVEHEELGVGTIVRIWAYDDIGVCLYVDFGSTVKKEVHPNFVRKITYPPV